MTARSVSGRVQRRVFVYRRPILQAAAYDLSLNRYRKVEREEIVHESPAAIFADLQENLGGNCEGHEAA